MSECVSHKQAIPCIRCQTDLTDTYREQITALTAQVLSLQTQVAGLTRQRDDLRRQGVVDAP